LVTLVFISALYPSVEVVQMKFICGTASHSRPVIDNHMAMQQSNWCVT
jgi:hypothetical protein